jgi:hypothetical protein
MPISMRTIACPKCGRAFPGESIGSYGVFCPACGAQVENDSVTFGRAVSELKGLPGSPPSCQRCRASLAPDRPFQTWDGQPYCLACTQDAGLGEFNPEKDQLEEIVVLPFLWSAGRALWSGAFMATMVTLMVFGLFLLVAIAAILAVGMVNFGGVLGHVQQIGALRGLALVFGAWWLLISIVAFPMSIIGCLFRRRRRISIREGQFEHETRFGRFVLPLTDGRWKVAKPAFDNLSVFFPWQPLISIQFGQVALVCGFTPRARSMWEGYFNLTGVQKAQPSRLGRWAAFVIVGCVAGGVLGTLTGHALAVLAGDPRWAFVCSFLGMVDGAVSAMMYMVVSAGMPKKWLRDSYAPAVTAMTFALLALKVGIMLGLANALLCALVNAALGVAIGIAIRPHLKEATAAESSGLKAPWPDMPNTERCPFDVARRHAARWPKHALAVYLPLVGGIGRGSPVAGFMNRNRSFSGLFPMAVLMRVWISEPSEVNAMSFAYPTSLWNCLERRSQISKSCRFPRLGMTLSATHWPPDEMAILSTERI